MSNGHHFFHTWSCVAKSIQVFLLQSLFSAYLNLTTANFDSYGNVSFDPCEFTFHTAANAENNDWLISPLWEVPVVLSQIFSFTVYARAWWTGFMHPAGLSKFFKCTNTSLENHSKCPTIQKQHQAKKI
jgi:hypothetical protein